MALQLKIAAPHTNKAATVHKQRTTRLQQTPTRTSRTSCKEGINNSSSHHHLKEALVALVVLTQILVEPPRIERGRTSVGIKEVAGTLLTTTIPAISSSSKALNYRRRSRLP